MFWTVILPLLVYWLVFFTIHFIVVEYGQNYLYNEPPNATGWRVTLGSLIAAVAATYFRPSFETMFTSTIQWSALQAILWFGIFTIIYQFQPQHAIGLSLATFLLFPGLTSMAVDGMTKASPIATSTTSKAPNKPIRRSGGSGVMPADSEPAKEKENVEVKK